MEYTEEQLEVLLYSDDYRDREIAAKNGYGLDILVHDKEHSVREAVAEQGYGHDILARDKFDDVRCVVARCTEDPEIINELVHDGDWLVRWNIASRGYGLDILVNDVVKDVRTAAKKMIDELQQNSSDRLNDEVFLEGVRDMSDNKVGILSTKMTVGELVAQNLQYNYSFEDNILSNNKGSWAFVFQDDGLIHLTMERHVPEDLMVELLIKYGGEYYASEYDKKPTKVYEGQEKSIKEKVDELLSGSDSMFAYMMLDRMRSDCEYYLGNGNHYAGHLWAGNEKDHIAYMKEIWERFPKDEKPEWLPYDKILEYEDKMCGVEVFFTFGSWEKFPYQMGYISITAPSVKMAIEEFRRNYPDINEGTLNCSDYYYTEESKARIREHGNGAGCHRRIVVESKDLSVDDIISKATQTCDEVNKDVAGKNDIEIEKE